MVAYLKWRSLCAAREARYLVKGTELSRALYGPNSRFSVTEVRMYGADGYADVYYRVRDASLISDAEIRDGVSPPIVANAPTLDDALAFCDRATGEE